MRLAEAGRRRPRGRRTGGQTVAAGETAIVTIRPERIALDDGAARSAATLPRAGTVRESLYAGPTTRFVVELDGGGELMVVRQNASTTLRGRRGAAGQPVTSCVWEREYTRVIGTTRGGGRSEKRILEDRCSIIAVLALWRLSSALRRMRRRRQRAAASSSRDRAPTSTRRARASSNIVDWEGYADQSFVKDVREGDRLQGQRTCRRHLGRDVHEVPLRRRRPVRPRLLLG